MKKLPLDSTLILPLSGDPAAFNHFVLAEWTLRAEPLLQQVVFLLSNGQHPDPTKVNAAVPASVRQSLLQQQIDEIADPEQSYLARLAQHSGEPLRLCPSRLGLSTLEFEYSRPVPTAESLARLAGRDALEKGVGQPSGQIQIAVGTDLVQRMADPRIFSDQDVEFLARAVHYRIFERGVSPADALLAFQEARGLPLCATPIPRAAILPWMRPFLDVASTRVREAAEAGDPLAGMVTAGTARRIVAQGLYHEGREAHRILDTVGQEIGSRSALTMRLDSLDRELRMAGRRLGALLMQRAHASESHTLALVETSAAGALTSALASVSGASRYFLQSRFAYDARSKAELLSTAAGPSHQPAPPAPPPSAVSAEMARSLARAIRQCSGAAFGLAETGMAGPPDGQRRSLKSGSCWLALASATGDLVYEVRLNPFLTRREHQLRFAIGALKWLAGNLQSEEIRDTR